MTHGVQEAFRRPEEATAVRDARLGEDLVEVEAEGAPDLQVLPVVPGAQGRQKGVGIGRAQPESDHVDRPDHGDGLLGAADGGHDSTLAPEHPPDHGHWSPEPRADHPESITFGSTRVTVPVTECAAHLLFPDNGAWRMAATPLGRHFPILGFVSPRSPRPRLRVGRHPVLSTRTMSLSAGRQSQHQGCDDEQPFLRRPRCDARRHAPATPDRGVRGRHPGAGGFRHGA